MNILAFELPDDLTERPAWLEQQLVGLRLRELVQQLELVGETHPNVMVDNQDFKPLEPRSLETILGDQREGVLAKGLSVLVESQLQLLIRHPRMLLALQEFVLTDGGSYWQSVQRSDEHRLIAAAPWQRISEAIRDESGLSDDSPAKFEKPSESVRLSGSQLSPTTSTRRWSLAALAAIAATILIALFPWSTKSIDQRFFASKEVFDSPLRDRAYLEHVAATVTRQWKPDLELKTYRLQMEAFCKSCDRFLVAEHKQLSPTAVTAVNEACSKWRDKMRASIRDLDQGRDFKIVRNEANAILQRIGPVLNEIPIRS